MNALSVYLAVTAIMAFVAFVSLLRDDDVMNQLRIHNELEGFQGSYVATFLVMLVMALAFGLLWPVTVPYKIARRLKDDNEQR